MVTTILKAPPPLGKVPVTFTFPTKFPANALLPPIAVMPLLLVLMADTAELLLLVAITPACGFVGPMGAIFLGLVAGVVCFWAVTGLKSMFGYDDSLDVFGVHGIGGIIGSVGTGFLASTSFGGGGYGEGVTMGGQVITQIISVLVTIVWTGIISFILFKIIDAVIGLRVQEDEEREGLDSTQHGEAAYHT